MTRAINGSFIDHYLDYTTLRGSEVARIWHKWSAISILAGSLKRHVHVIVPKGGWKLYPTTYVLLVGRPGLGKGLAMNMAMDIMNEAKVANVLTGKLTMPFVIELMAKGFTGPQPMGATSVAVSNDHSVFIHSSELSVFINAYKDTIEILTDLWDTLDRPFMTGGVIRGGKIVPFPSLNLLGGSAQEWLVKAIPHDAIGGGFTRRVNFVYADHKEPAVSSNSPNNGTFLSGGLIQLRDNLVSTLQHISTLRGVFRFDQAVLPLLEDYFRASEPDEFDDAATAGYVTSKPAHAIKLAMCLSASRSDSLVIEEIDFLRAVALVDEVQSSIKVVFRSVGTNMLVESGDKLLRFIESRGTVTEQQILAALWKDISRNDLTVLLETFYAANLVQSHSNGRHTVWKLVHGVTTKPKAQTKGAP